MEINSTRYIPIQATREKQVTPVGFPTMVHMLTTLRNRATTHLIPMTTEWLHHRVASSQEIDMDILPINHHLRKCKYRLDQEDTTITTDLEALVVLPHRHLHLRLNHLLTTTDTQVTMITHLSHLATDINNHHRRGGMVPLPCIHPSSRNSINTECPDTTVVLLLPGWDGDLHHHLIRMDALHTHPHRVAIE